MSDPRIESPAGGSVPILARLRERAAGPRR